MVARWERRRASQGLTKQAALWTPEACPTGDCWGPVNKKLKFQVSKHLREVTESTNVTEAGCHPRMPDLTKRSQSFSPTPAPKVTSQRRD